MKWRKGPRPWPVHIFALIFLSSGLWNLMAGIGDADYWVTLMSQDLPVLEWDRDKIIVLHSAMFTITLIPLIAVWGCAFGIARIIVTLFALLALPTALASVWLTVQGQLDDWSILVDSVAMLLGVALLYTPQTSNWLNRNEVETETFA